MVRVAGKEAALGAGWGGGGDCSSGMDGFNVYYIVIFHYRTTRLVTEVVQQYSSSLALESL